MITILYNIVALFKQLQPSFSHGIGEDLNKRSRFCFDPRVYIMSMFCICTVCIKIRLNQNKSPLTVKNVTSNVKTCC